MSRKVLSRPIEQWLVISLIDLFSMIINCIILTKEWKKRKSKQNIFTSKMLQILPLVTIIFAVFEEFFGFLLYFNGFCYFSYHIAFSLASQFIFIGLYQISRLYYCFAQSQVYSNKGYPNWLINTMYIVAILCIINTFIAPWFCVKIPIYCVINSQYQSVFEYNGNPYISAYPQWFGISVFIYFLWDITTLLLYVIKIISFKKYKSQQNAVYNRIMSITHRILILTILYEISWILTTIIGIIYLIFPTHGIIAIVFAAITGLKSITISYSIFLMQQHNDCEYLEFLILSHKIGVYNICCCFKSIIKIEIEIHSQETKSQNAIEYKNKNTDNTICETADISVKNEHTVPRLLSIETTIQNNITQQ